MSKTIKDTDYLVISARIKAMETGLLTRERMEQILEARSDEEAAKILQECGYPALDARDPEALDAALSADREEMLADLSDGAPDTRYIELFKLKYDYHNVKALLKAEAMGTAPDGMLMDMGRVPVKELQAAVRSGELDSLPPLLARAAEEAREVLNTTRDPQLSDTVLDRWCYRDMADLAEQTGSEFLKGYVQTVVDALNLRTLVRAIRMGKSEEFLRGVLLEGGSVAAASILTVCANRGSGLNDLYGPTRFQAAAEAGTAALKGGALTEFEKLCDDAVSEYLAGAQMVPFGEAPLVGYLAARETEYTNLRILLMGRGAGLAPEVIRSRLRQSYV
ncbi:V/A-type H+-transporting ATPase subunit C [Oscillibacter sp. PC13]|uniref:V-type ATPase subunit n=1 Tax=Oscillibacter sp. PC13 TaxID=1855299 RepID=UPI0008E2570D|nr:V-type ATPase subunit [Oscillibacter sp. PC13]SFP09208.1 V/A-type H+-transporting ATPase subunit C [Oscillibacter sp. PC13]